MSVWARMLRRQPWPKVNLLPGPVAEVHGELVRSNHFEAGDANDRVSHYLSGSILTGG